MDQPAVQAFCNHCQQPFNAKSSTDGLCMPCFIAGHRGLNCDHYCKTKPEPIDPRIIKAFEHVYGGRLTTTEQQEGQG